MLPLALIVLAGVDGGFVNAGVDVDAGTAIDTLTAIYAACPEVEFTDGGVAPLAFPVKLTGSFIEELSADAGATSDWYTPYPRPQRTGCRLAACESRVTQMDTFTRSLTLPWWAAVSIGVSAAFLGAWGMWEVCAHVPALCGGR